MTRISSSLGRPGSTLARVGFVLTAVAASTIILISMLLLPIFVSTMGRDEQNWSRLASVGEAYGPAAALTTTFLIVGASLLLQQNQARHERILLSRELHFNIVKLAMEDPIYGQCWGPRVSPPDMDERLFYYLNMIILLWYHGWEGRQLTDHQVKVYAAALFESEVAREYWKRFGLWVAPAKGREKIFRKILNEEYVRAVDQGPPTRPYEPGP